MDRDGCRQPEPWARQSSSELAGRPKARPINMVNLYSRMKTKTTIELPEELVIAAKRHAAARRTTLRTLVERGLRTELRRGRAPRAKRTPIRWITVDGGLPDGLDVANRAAMMDRLRRRS